MESNDLLARQRAAQAVLKRFQNKRMVMGKRDCVQMGSFLLRERGRASPLAKAGSYTSAYTGARVMKKLGYASLMDALDAIGLERIAPASALLADIVMLPAEGAFGGAISMAVGNGRVLGYHQEIETADILQPLDFIGAWRT